MQNRFQSQSVGICEELLQEWGGGISCFRYKDEHWKKLNSETGNSYHLYWDYTTHRNWQHCGIKVKDTLCDVDKSHVLGNVLFQANHNNPCEPFKIVS